MEYKNLLKGGIICYFTTFLNYDIKFFNMFLFFQKRESHILSFKSRNSNMMKIVIYLMSSKVNIDVTT